MQAGDVGAVSVRLKFAFEDRHKSEVVSSGFGGRGESMMWPSGSDTLEYRLWGGGVGWRALRVARAML